MSRIILCIFKKTPKLYTYLTQKHFVLGVFDPNRVCSVYALAIGSRDLGQVQPAVMVTQISTLLITAANPIDIINFKINFNKMLFVSAPQIPSN